MTRTNIRYRPTTEDDEAFLRDMQYEALFVPEGMPLFPKSILDEPSIRKYYMNWGHGDLDIGFIALKGPKKIGAAWARIFPEENSGFGFVDEQTPEFSIAVIADYRAQGVGSNLLKKLEQACREQQVTRLSLSVDHRNPARHFYSRRGYKLFTKNHPAHILVKKLAPT